MTDEPVVSSETGPLSTADPAGDDDPDSRSWSVAQADTPLVLEVQCLWAGTAPPDPFWSDIEAIARRALSAWAALSLPDLAGQAALVLADDATVRPLNAEWRGKDRATNVLSFPAEAALPDGSEATVGDLVLAYETVAGEAAAQGKNLEAHTVHLIVHGLLHLAGYDHENAEEAELMEAQERAALNAVGIADPYTLAEGVKDGAER